MAEEIRGPIPPDYRYERVVDGQVVETTYPLSGLATTPANGTTSIDDAGNVVPPPVRMADPAAPPPPGALDESLSGPMDAGGTASTGYSGTSSNRGYSSSRRSYGGGGYSSGGYSGGSGYSGGGGFGPEPPRYADNTLHPFFGGPPRIPGGPAALQDVGLDTRQQVYVPGGAAAGPYETRAAPSPAGGLNGSYGASGSGGSGGGGGGGASDLYYKLKAKLSGGGSSSSTETTNYEQQYRRQGRRSDRAYDRYNEALYNPEPLPVHGWAKRVGHFKPGSIDAALSSPSAILPDVFPGYAGGNTRSARRLESLPMTDLALASGGTSRRGMTAKVPEVKVPSILRQQGVKAPKPDYPRMLDPSDVVNEMASLYGGIAQETPGGGDWFDTEQLLNNLANAKKKSIVRQQFGQAFETDPGAAMANAERLVSNVLSTKTGSLANRALLNLVPTVSAQMGNAMLKRKPKKAGRYLNQLAGAFD